MLALLVEYIFLTRNANIKLLKLVCLLVNSETIDLKSYLAAKHSDQAPILYCLVFDEKGWLNF